RHQDSMKTVVVFTALALFWQHSLVTGHALGRPSLPSNLDQLKSLLERIEETLADGAQEESDYEEPTREAEPSRDGSPEQQNQPSEASQRNRLNDLLLSLRKRASSCFGARMDRIGNISGLGCNSGRGTTQGLRQGGPKSGPGAMRGPLKDFQWPPDFNLRIKQIWPESVV
uniref:Natriuretic peptides A n=2 Tax=Xiphophorus maculatus TaxID=8083 RepID=A0A3B5QMH0_XIPMA